MCTTANILNSCTASRILCPSKSRLMPTEIIRISPAACYGLATMFIGIMVVVTVATRFIGVTSYGITTFILINSSCRHLRNRAIMIGIGNRRRT